MYGLYLHLPFCRHRCAYCDFNTYAGLDDLIPQYARALQGEIRFLGERTTPPLRVDTVFLGGGTPSLLPLDTLEGILCTLGDSFSLTGDAEISLEANPGTVDLDYLRGLRALGVNRLSFGVQSANPDELRLLERIHNYPQAIQAVRWARRAGFENINLDLIFGLPYQSLEAWQRSLELALGLHAEHLALYALTLEHGTPMQRWVGRGLMPLPDPDLAADMYEWAAERLAQAGYMQYEISNWACDAAHACRHNLHYWRGEPYLGLGAGAHGYAEGVRTVAARSPQAYIRRLDAPAARSLAFPRTPATVEAHRLTPVEEMGEYMMMGLRLTQEGVSARGFAARFGLPLEAAYGAQISRLIALGLLEWCGEDRLRLTAGARLLGNQVFMAFVGEGE
ncbi:MAG: radical SAM family heme chaperone HemW [Anaerolineales bacterium]